MCYTEKFQFVSPNKQNPFLLQKQSVDAVYENNPCLFRENLVRAVNKLYWQTANVLSYRTPAIHICHWALQKVEDVIKL